MIYLVILIVICFCAYAFDYKKSSVVREKFAYFLLLLIFICLAGFRYKLGGDTFNYMRDFEIFPEIDDPYLFFTFITYAPLSAAFFSLIKTFFDDFIVLQFIHATIINCIVFFFIQKYSKYKFLNILFYYIFYYLYFNTEILRESLAIVIFLLAVPFFLEKKWISYYVCAFICYLFHSSAAFLFLLPFLLFIKPNVWGIGLLVVIITLYQQFNLIIVSYLPSALQKYFEIYQDYEINWKGVLSGFVLYIICPSIYFIFYKGILKRYKFSVFYTPFLFVGLFSLYLVSALRFYNYLLPIVGIVFIDTIFEMFFEKKQLFVTTFFFVCLFSYKTTYYLQEVSNSAQKGRFYIRWFPYTHILAKDNNNQIFLTEERAKWVSHNFDNLKDK